MTYLLLGRTGDIISILPFLKAESDAGQKPTLIVSRDYSSVLDGVSYVNSVVFDGGIEALRPAFEWAYGKYPDVRSLQVVAKPEDAAEITYKPAGQETAKMTSFVKEYWKLAGKMPLWDDMLPLVFDQRSAFRELKLLDCFFPARPKGRGRPPKEKPLVLMATTGTSSPFPYVDLLRELIRLRFGENSNVMELPRADRIYDLLALYERAHCLVSIDSAPLHLAWAVPDLPVIALTNDRPILWNGSSWLPQWAWCCRYHDWPERATEMLTAIETCREKPQLPFIHLWNEYESKRKPDRFSRDILPVYVGMCGRDSAIVLKDKKRVPYLKDCLRMALQRAKEAEHICLTRPETKFGRELDLTKPCFSYRMTRNGAGDTFAPIVDLFCARKDWWKSHLSEIPDYLLGGDFTWSDGLRVLFQKHGAVDATGACYREAKA